MKRVLSLVLTAVMCLSLLPLGVLAEEEIAETPAETFEAVEEAEPAPELEVEPTLEPEPEPVVDPETAGEEEPAASEPKQPEKPADPEDTTEPAAEEEASLFREAVEAEEKSDEKSSEDALTDDEFELTSDGMSSSEVIQQINSTYSAAKTRAGMSSFNGLCATYVNWQLVILGINSSYVGGNGNQEYDNYKDLSKSSGGYSITAYPASSYNLNSALNAISSNGTKDVYNILVGFEKGSGSDGAIYGHTCFIHAIIGGVVYFSESFGATIGGTSYSEGAPIKCSISTFCSYYNSWTVLDGVIHFGGSNTYTVTFNANGGTCSETTRSVISGDAIGALPTPTRSNYRFMGWFTEPSGGTEITYNTVVYSSMTLYAHWYFESGGLSISVSDRNLTMEVGSSTQVIVTIDAVSLPSHPSLVYECEGVVEAAWEDWGDNSWKYGPITIYADAVGTGSVWIAVIDDDTNETLAGTRINVTVTSKCYTFYIDGQTFNIDMPCTFDVEALSSSVQWVYNYDPTPMLLGDEYLIVTTAPGATMASLGILPPTPSKAGYEFVGWDYADGQKSFDYDTVLTEELLEDITRYISSPVVWPRFEAKTYTVMYNANGGSGVPGSQTKTYGKTLTLSSTVPTRTGYTFEGWATSASATIADYQPGGSYTDNADVTLYAVWSMTTSGYCGDNVRWAYDAASGTLTITGTGAITDYGESLDMPWLDMPWYEFRSSVARVIIGEGVTSIPRYAFYGFNALWYVSIPESMQSIGYCAFNFSYNKEVYITSLENWLEISFDNCPLWGGSDLYLNGQLVEHLVIPDGVTEIPALSFEGGRSIREITIPSSVISIGNTAFNSCDNLTDVYYLGTEEEWNEVMIGLNNGPITGAVIHFLQTYTVTYNANGGSGAPGNQTKTHGTALTLSSTAPTRTGYTFLGWATSASATTAVYQPGGSYTNNADVTLYAVWQIKTYTVTYNANGGSGAPASQTKTYGETLTLSSTVPTRTGYTFKNWNTRSDGTGTTYAPGASYTKNGKLTLYAVWQVKTYTVTYDANGGSGAPGSQTKTHGTALTLSSTAPTRTGYTFQGWATSASATTAVYQPGGSYTNNADVTLYAVWQIKTYTVTFDANGGSGAPGSQTKTHGTALTLSSTEPTRDGYNFLGWATSASATTAVYQPGGSYINNADVTLYAVWQIKTYTVTYDANGGSGAPESQTKTHGTALTLSSIVPTRDGYTFLGWSTSVSATTEGASEEPADEASEEPAVVYQPGGSYTVDASVTLYAIWEKTEIPVTGAQVIVSDATARPGTEFTVTVSIVENPGIAAFTFEVEYDESVLTWISVERGDMSVGTWDIAVGDELRWFNSDNYTSDGTLLTLTFRVNDGAESGTTSIMLTYDPDDVCNEDLDNVTITVTAGTVTIPSHTPGDINGDGSVNNKDLVRLLQYIKGKSTDVVEAAVDVNGDGSVNNKDLVRLLQYIKGKDVVIY